MVETCVKCGTLAKPGWVKLPLDEPKALLHCPKCAVKSGLMPDFSKCHECGNPFSERDAREGDWYWIFDEAKHKLVCRWCVMSYVRRRAWGVGG